MTEEQAAKILRQGSKMAWDAEEFCEAYDMGIKALERQSGEDCVSRADVIKYLNTNMAWYDEDGYLADSDEKLKAITDLVNGVSPVTPTHGTCKDCKKYRNSLEYCTQWVMPTNDDFYCADYEKAR